MSDQIIKLETLQLAKQAGVNLTRDPCNYSQTLVQKWLREKHNIHINIHSINNSFYTNQILINKDDGSRYYENRHDDKHETYESALEFALCIGLKYVIENKK